MDKDRFSIKLKPLVILFSFIFLVVLFSSAVAGCWIENLSLEKKGDYTYLSIYVKGDYEFTHFIEPPKEHRPHRIVVDISDALHKLPKKEFYDIPQGKIRAIRTSQFQVSPERITRVVLDLENPVIYKVEKKDKNKITLALLTTDDKPFDFWSCKPSELELTKGQKGASPQTQEEQRLAFHAPLDKPEQKQKEAAKISETKEEFVKKGTEVYSPKSEKKEKFAKKTSETKTTSEKQLVALKDEKKTTEEKPKPKKGKIARTPKPNEIVLPSWTEKESAPEIKPEGEKEATAFESDTTTQVITQAIVSDTFLYIDTLAEEEQRVRLDTIPGRIVLTYSSYGSRDPFVPLTEKISFEFGEAPLPDVESLNLVGILEDRAGLRALLEDDQGYGYIMEQGDRVQNGYVLKVFEDRIVFEITEYGWSRTVALELSS